MSIKEDKNFMKKVGIMTEEDDTDPVKLNYAVKCVKYNAKKALLVRYHSITVSFLKKSEKRRYRLIWIDPDNMHVQRRDRIIMEFRQYKSSLYDFDVDDYVNSNTGIDIIHNYLLDYINCRRNKELLHNS